MESPEITPESEPGSIPGSEVPVDPGSAPVQEPSVVTVPAGDEVILVGPGGTRLHRLNPTGSLVWRCLDGTVTLAGLAAELGGALGADPAALLPDLVDLVATLQVGGLLGGDDAGPTGGTSAQSGRADPWLDAQLRMERTVGVEVRIDAVQIALRVDDRRVAEQVAEQLAQQVDARGEVSLGPSIADPVPLYTVVVAPPARPIRSLHLLYRESERVRRCRALDDLVRVTVADVLAVADRELSPTPALTGIGLRRGRRAVVVDPMFAPTLDNLERALARSGILRLDQPYHPVDLAGRPRILGPGPRPAGDRADDALDLVGVLARRTRGDASTPGAWAIDHAALATGLGRRIDPGSLALLTELRAAVPVHTVTDARLLPPLVESLLAT